MLHQPLWTLGHFYLYYIGGVDRSDRKTLRQRLQCKSFKWYLDNVCPGGFIRTENVQGFGQVSTQHKCLDNLQQGNNDEQYELGIYDCHSRVTSSQVININKIQMYFWDKMWMSLYVTVFLLDCVGRAEAREPLCRNSEPDSKSSASHHVQVSWASRQSGVEDDTGES